MDNIGYENERVEFKENTIELDKGIRSLVAMLNKNGNGTVFFGVKNNGDVVGQDIGKTTLRTITQFIDNHVDPAIIAEVIVMDSSDGRKYISVKAKGDNRPYACRGIIYIRTGEEDRVAPMSELRKMFESSGDNLKHSLSNNQKLTFRGLCSFMDQRGIRITDNKHMHSNFNLLNTDGRFNIQGQLLSDQNPSVLSVVVFSGKDRLRMSMRKEFQGSCLLKEAADVLEYIKTLNETFVTVDSGFRKENRMFDEDAFKEAWINACAHNRWILSISPAIHIFDDRMEIISYGDKPYWLDTEEFYTGKSMPVNDSLMRIFELSGLSEHTGHGVPIIVNRYGRDNIRISNTGIVVTIPFVFERSIARVRNDDRLLTKKEELLIDMIRTNPRNTLDVIAKMCGISRSYVGKSVVKLQKEGIIARQGSNKDGIWIVVNDRDR